MPDTLSAYERIIWSADVPDVPTLVRCLNEMPNLRLIKIDRLFVETHGWEIFGLLRDRGLLVFDDAKLAEIPIKLEGLARVHARRANPWMLNCMLGGVSNGSYTDRDPDKELDGLKRFADACLNNGIKPCGVTVLTSKQPHIVADEYNQRTVTGQVLWYVEQALQAGFTDIVCSPKELEAIRRVYGDSLDLNTPGVRPAGSAADDQARTDTPSGAVKLGATRLVIGRPLTNGPGTPAENLQAIADELEAAA